MKPIGRAQGLGIFLFNKLSQVGEGHACMYTFVCGWAWVCARTALCVLMLEGLLEGWPPSQPQRCATASVLVRSSGREA